MGVGYFPLPPGEGRRAPSPGSEGRNDPTFLRTPTYVTFRSMRYHGTTEETRGSVGYQTIRHHRERDCRHDRGGPDPQGGRDVVDHADHERALFAVQPHRAPALSEAKGQPAKGHDPKRALARG